VESVNFRVDRSECQIKSADYFGQASQTRPQENRRTSGV
jgi:hypothetical protein